MTTREEPYTLFDRVAVGFGAGVIAVVVGSVLWFMFSCRRAGCWFWIPYEYVGYFAIASGIVGFVFGPERAAALIGFFGRDRTGRN